MVDGMKQRYEYPGWRVGGEKFTACVGVWDVWVWHKTTTPWIVVVGPNGEKIRFWGDQIGVSVRELPVELAAYLQLKYGACV